MHRSLRHRIRLLVSLAALALVVVSAVTLVLGRLNEEQLSGIETRYVPLLELDRDLKTIFGKIPRALEDAATAADEAELHDADALEADLVRRLAAGAPTIIDNGGDPAALTVELERYYRNARAVSSAIADGVSAAQLGAQIEQMLRVPGACNIPPWDSPPGARRPRTTPSADFSLARSREAPIFDSRSMSPVSWYAAFACFTSSAPA